MFGKVRLLLLTSLCIAALGAVSAGAGAAAAPAPVTGGATDVTGTSAVVAGAIAPAGYPVEYTFYYGTTRGYGSYTVPVTLPASSKTEVVAAVLTHLKPGRTYHYVLAVNVDVVTYYETYSYGKLYFYGDDATLTTKKPGSVTLTSTAKVKGKKADISLKCASVSPCKGTFTLYKRLKLGRKFHNEKVGSSRYSIKAGKKGTIKIKLSKLILAVLDISPGHKTTVKATDKPSTGQKGFSNKNLTLKG